MNNPFNALNYKPREQTYGQQFLYDGTHTIEDWKALGKSNSEYWQRRDNFVQANYKAIEEMVNDIAHAPVKDIANIVTDNYGGFTSSQRVNQFLSSREAWETVKKVTDGTGTVMSLDLETIGDVTTVHHFADGFAREGYAHVTEVGLAYKEFVDGVQQPIKFNQNYFGLVIGIDEASEKAKQIQTVINDYKLHGFDALNATDQRLIESLSTYGYGNYYEVFNPNVKIDRLGGERFVVLSEKTLSSMPNVTSHAAVDKGFENLKMAYQNGATEERISQVIKTEIERAMDDADTAMIGANVTFEANLLHQWGIDSDDFMKQTADTLYANTAIAKAYGISGYKMQKNSPLSMPIKPDAPLSVESSKRAAGIGMIETHHGASDALDQIDIVINKLSYGSRPYIDNALYALDELQDKVPKRKSNGFYFVHSGQLDKTKADQAVIDGTPTQSYSFRGQYWQIDEDHTGYNMMEQLGPEDIGKNPQEKVFILSMQNDEGIRFSKQFATEADKDKWLERNALYVNNPSKQVRETQSEITDIDMGRRAFDDTLNPTDVKVKTKKIDGKWTEVDVSGYAGMKQNLELYDKIKYDVTNVDQVPRSLVEKYTADFLSQIDNADAVSPQEVEKYVIDTFNASTKDVENLPDELLREYDIVSNYQKRAWAKTYEKIDSEEVLLKGIRDYIETNMPEDATNYQKTTAFKNMRQDFIEYTESLGYTPYSKPHKSQVVIAQDALSIDIKVDTESDGTPIYKTIRGYSQESINRDLTNLFIDLPEPDKYILSALDDLEDRGVLTEDVVSKLKNNIRKTDVPITDINYRNAILGDVSIALDDVLQPVRDWEYSPVSFINNIDSKNLTEQQRHAILALSNSSVYDDIQLAAKTQFEKDGVKKITLSSIASDHSGTQLGIVGIHYDDIVKNAMSINHGVGQEYIQKLGHELGYDDSQIESLFGFFNAVNADKTYKSYAINGRQGIQTFIINPNDKHTSAFLVFTTRDKATQVADMLTSGQVNDLTTKKELEELFTNKAAIHELKKINRVDVGSINELLKGEANIKNIQNLFAGGNDMLKMSTISQGKVERFAVPGINVYTTGDGKLHAMLRNSGDELFEIYRKNAGRAFDYIEAGDFDTANQIFRKSVNEYLTNLSSPASYRGYDGVRQINYSLNDISHAGFFDYSGLDKVFKHQVHTIANAGQNTNPLYLLTQVIGVMSGNLREEDISKQLSESQIDTILGSNYYEEFSIKNMLVGNVYHDQSFQDAADRISRFSGIKREVFNENIFDKNMLDLMIEEATRGNKLYGPEVAGVLTEVKKGLVGTPILNETNTKRRYFSLLKPGEIRDIGYINSTMRPTYTQQNNGIRYVPELIKVDPKQIPDTVLGPVSRSNMEELMTNTVAKNDNVFVPNNGGMIVKFNQAQHVFTTPVKQMSDIELQIKYKELNREFANSTDEKLKYAYGIFKNNYISLYEDKSFGAPVLFNDLEGQFSDTPRFSPLMAPDIKKVKIAEFQDITDTQRRKIKRELGDRVVKRGEVIANINNHDIIYDGPAAQLGHYIDELSEAGEAYVTPAERMVSDIKVQFGQEKTTLHSIIIDKAFMDTHKGHFDTPQEALDYFQYIFDRLTGYKDASDDIIGLNGNAYRATVISNMSGYKHGNNIATDSVWRTIIHEYQKNDQLYDLALRLNKMEHFEDFNFRVDSTGKYLVSNQRHAKGTEKAIKKLYDEIMFGDSGYEIDKTIRTRFQEMASKNIVFMEGIRSNVNEIMGTKVILDERMTQAIRLRALQKDYSSLKSVEEQYIEQLRREIRNGYYSNGNMVDLYGNTALNNALDEQAANHLSNAKNRQFNSMIAKQEKTISGLEESLAFYAKGFDVNSHNVLRFNMSDVLSNLPQKDISYNEVKNMVFMINGEPSNFLKAFAMEHSGSTKRNINSSSIYIDFGKDINVRINQNDTRTMSGILIPVFDVHADIDDTNVVFTKSQGKFVDFLRKYQKYNNAVDSEEQISKAIRELYDSFRQELNMFDKDSLAYKTFGRYLLPNSSQLLAQDTVAPIVEKIMSDDEIIKGVTRENEIRTQFAINKLTAEQQLKLSDELDSIIATRKQKLYGIAEAIRNNTGDESHFALTGLLNIDQAYKGIEYIDGKRYFATVNEVNLNTMKTRFGVDEGVIGYQLYQDLLENGKIAKFETNAKFDTKVADIQAIEAQIRANLSTKGIHIDEGKQLLKELNNYTALNPHKVNDITSSMGFLGIDYLQDVGVLGENWRPPVFKEQPTTRYFLNNNGIGNDQVRESSGGATNVRNALDHDGDTVLDRLQLNSNGGLRTLQEEKWLREMHYGTIKANNEIMADLIENAAAFKKDGNFDIAYTGMNQVKLFDSIEFERGLNEWATNNKISIQDLDVDDLTEGQLLRLAHSDEMQSAYFRMSQKTNLLENDKVILASLAARIRKANIGSISTPDYKLRDTLIAIEARGVTEQERQQAYNILRDLTGVDGSKLMDIAEQKSIDVKHILDAANIAETPKWTRGITMMFNDGKNQIAVRNKGLMLAMESVNKSTLKFKTDTEFQKAFEYITKTSRESMYADLDTLKQTLKTSKEAYLADQSNVALKRSFLKAQKNVNKQEYLIGFRALYDIPDIKMAKELQAYALKKNVTLEAFADEIVEVLNGNASNKSDVVEDFIKRTDKLVRTNEILHANLRDIYINPGDIKTLTPEAYMVTRITESSIYLQHVNFKTLEPISGDYVKYTGTYAELNQILADNYMNPNNAYRFINELDKDAILQEAKMSKVEKTLNSIYYNTFKGNAKKPNGLETLDAFYNISSTLKKEIAFGTEEFEYISSLMGKNAYDFQHLVEAQDYIEDYKYYTSRKSGNYTGVDALIRDLNHDIAQNKNTDKYANMFYDDIVKREVLRKAYIGEDTLDAIRLERISLDSFDVNAYTAQKAFLNDNLYDIISAEKELNKSFDALESLRDKALRSNITASEIQDMIDVIDSRSTTIENTLNAIRKQNDITLKQVSDNVFGLFNSQKQMDIYFKWGAEASENTMVGFGKYMGTSFKDLSIADADFILNSKAVGTSANEAYAVQKTKELLTKYKSLISTETPSVKIGKNQEILEPVLGKNLQFKNAYSEDFIRSAFAESNKTAKESMKRKTLSGGIIDSLKNIDMKSKLPAVGIIVGSLAALGVANNLLHNDKHKSPVSPEFSNDHNDPGFKNNSVQSPQVAPPSKGRTIYVDKPSGFQFKVSAKTNNYINDVNNAKLIGLANGGQANVYSQQDTSGVTDNWLANKFAELT